MVLLGESGVRLGGNLTSEVLFHLRDAMYSTRNGSEVNPWLSLLLILCELEELPLSRFISSYVN